MDDDMIEQFFKGQENDSSPMATLARWCRELYEHLTELGFDPEQAFELVKTYLMTTISNCRQP